MMLARKTKGRVAAGCPCGARPAGRSPNRKGPTIRQVTSLLCAVAAVGGAQATRAAVPTVRPLGPITATTSVPLRQVKEVRVLSDGRLLIHDSLARRVWLLDSSLSNARSVIDTTGATRNAYGNEGPKVPSSLGLATLLCFLMMGRARFSCSTHPAIGAHHCGADRPAASALPDAVLDPSGRYLRSGWVFRLSSRDCSRPSRASCGPRSDERTQCDLARHDAIGADRASVAT